jgi:glycine cleavage system aminomethyltransferase T
LASSTCRDRDRASCCNRSPRRTCRTRLSPSAPRASIDIGYARLRCNRITYVAELGYELNIPAEQAVLVYDRVVEAGKDFGLRHAGLRALGSLRMEKGYRDDGHDIDHTDDAYEAGLGLSST